MKKRILMIVMVVLLIFSTVLTLFSCNDDEKEPDDDIVVTSPTPDAHDLEGYTVKFAVCEGEIEHPLSKRSILPDEDSGDSLDITIINRNKEIESRYNCNIDITYYISDLTHSLSSEILSGSGDYDVFVGRQYDDIALCIEDCLVDVANHEDASPYINLESEFPYWSKEYINGLSCNGKLYWLTGCISLNYIGGFYCTFLNETLYKEKLEKTYGSIYDIVRNKEWTVDKMQMFSDAVVTKKDISVDELIGSEELIGVAMPIHHNANALAVASGVEFCDIDMDGSLYCPITSANNQLYNFFTQYFKLIDSDGVMKFDMQYAKAFEAFKKGNALMTSGYMHSAAYYLNDMEYDYCIIPTPMLNEEQGRYISGLRMTVNLFGISKNSQNIKASAVVLEAMCKESYRMVKPRYYDDVLGVKYTTDLDTCEMIDLITQNSGYVDMVLAFAYTTYFDGLGNMIMMSLCDTQRNMQYVMTKYGHAASYRNRHLTEIVNKLSGEEQ
ncbi:MAG: hypothetical protein E7633_08095 [Ruminococcaceae bacterium]|nr:hypothetical protein [Oscillospiraceae bacterium]